MSSLLEQAIVDASALKEAALKNAEASVVEKYSDEVKKNLDRLLEQDELGMPDPMGMGAMAETAPDADIDVPLGASEGEELCPCPDEGESTEVVINFDELAETLRSLNEEIQVELSEDEEIEEAKGKYDDGDGKDEKCDHVPCNESLREHYTSKKNQMLFEKLTKIWTK